METPRLLLSPVMSAVALHVDLKEFYLSVEAGGREGRTVRAESCFHDYVRVLIDLHHSGPAVFPCDV